MALLSGLMGALGWFSVPFYGWLLALGWGLSELRDSVECSFLGFPRVDGLQVAANGCLGGVRGRSSALVGVGSGVAP